MEYRIFQWSDSYSMGIDSIDEQHKQLFSFCNNLWINSHRSDEFSRNFFYQCVSDMVNFMQYHIFEEERLFSRIGFPDSRAHKDEHSKAASFLSRCMVYMDAGEEVWFKNSIPDLQKKILTHVTVSDRRFANYIHSLNHPRYQMGNRLPTELFLG
jgi:hemerythrin-like metal-binding protein